MSQDLEALDKTRILPAYGHICLAAINKTHIPQSMGHISRPTGNSLRTYKNFLDFPKILWYNMV